MKTFGMAIVFSALATPLAAQWLAHPTPGIPRAADGKPNLTAPAPRTPDGKVDMSGLWQRINQKYRRNIAADLKPEEIQPWARELVAERMEDLGKDHMAVQCLPWGPSYATSERLVKFIQTPGLMLMLDEGLAYRQIFMDGRPLESDPNPSWLGYSVGRWDDDTLVVESFGFNDRTWLDARGLPHTEDLRLTERYRRSTVGEMQVEVTAVDPGVLTTPRTTSYTMAFQPDTEMVEGVWECDQEHWVGRLSEVERTAVAVAPALLATYVGTYSGMWGTVPRTVRVTLTDGTLYASGLLGEPVRLIPQSDTFFMGADGLTFEFGGDGGAVTYLVERHVSGDWKYARRP